MASGSGSDCWLVVCWGGERTVSARLKEKEGEVSSVWRRKAGRELNRLRRNDSQMRTRVVGWGPNAFWSWEGGHSRE